MLTPIVLTTAEQQNLFIQSKKCLNGFMKHNSDSCRPTLSKRRFMLQVNDEIAPHTVQIRSLHVEFTPRSLLTQLNVQLSVKLLSRRVVSCRDVTYKLYCLFHCARYRSTDNTVIIETALAIRY
jgi:hypothetical protein